MTTMVANRNATLEESAEIIESAIEKYTSARYSKKQLAKMTGRSVLQKGFIRNLKKSLEDEYGITMLPDRDWDETITHFVFAKTDHFIRRGTKGNFCARGRVARNDSVEWIIRNVVNPLLDANDEEWDE